MMSQVLSDAIEEIERCNVPDLTPAIGKALTVMKALQCVLDPPHAPSLEHALANLDVSALVDDDGWPPIRYTLTRREP